MPSHFHPMFRYFQCDTNINHMKLVSERKEGIGAIRTKAAYVLQVFQFQFFSNKDIILDSNSRSLLCDVSQSCVPH